MAAFAATPAVADLRICNFTKSRVGIAIGYKDGEGWATEGWWNIAAGGCETLLRGKLAARLLILNKFPCLPFRWNCFRAFSHSTFRKASGKKSNVSGGG